MLRNETSGRPVRLVGLCLFSIVASIVASIGCRHPQRDSTIIAPTAGGQEKSVRPGINDPYKDADIDKWVSRFEGESREIFAARHRIVEHVGVIPGTDIADVGAGTGFFSMMFSEAVGPGGEVLAVDLVPEFLVHIEERARESGHENIRTVLCKENSVELADNSVDVVFVCDTYHHFEYPRSTLRSIYKALRPGGSLVVIDFERIQGQSRDWVINHVRAGKDVVISEITEAGFIFAEEVHLSPDLKENYFLRFRKPEEP